MSETETNTPKKTTRSRAAKPAAKAVAAQAPAVVLPFGETPMPAMEVPEAMREFAEKGIAQAREGYAKMKSVAEDATDMIEDSYEAARQRVLDFNMKALDAAKANTDATFDYVKRMMTVRTLAEAVELQTSFAREQFDAYSAQAKDMQAHFQALAEDTTKPIQSAMEKSMKDVAA